MTNPAICQQLAACCGSPAPYFDRDMEETRCRTCGRSLSSPSVPPDAYLSVESQNSGGNPKVDPTVKVSCVECGLELSAVRERCPGCGQVVVVFNSETIRGGAVYMLPEFDPPRLLRCSCCQQDLPQFCFNRNPRAAHRDFRNGQCRGCVAFQRRVKREQNPKAARARDRQNGEKFRAENPGYFNKPKTAESKESNRLAVARLAARKSGRPVLKQRPGKLAILQKPICRVYETCPLREFCTTEGKGLA